MTKKNYEPFSGEVCQRLRNLIELKKKSEGERKRMFGVRDQALENRAQAMQNNQPKDADRYTKDYGDAILEIKRLDKEVRWCDGEIMEAVEKADQKGLFSDADVTVPDFRPGMEIDEEDDDEDQQKLDTRPVGRPGKKPAAAPDPGQGTGVDEHLRVSINELDIAENVKGKVRAAGYDQVIQVVMLLDQRSIDHRAKLDLNENQYSALKKSIDTFRAKHTKAIKDEALGEARGDGVAQAPKGTRVGRGAGSLKLAE